MPSRRAARSKLLLILAVCAAPVFASYFFYYFIRPDGRTNYGDLIEPQRAVGSVAGSTPEGGATRLADFDGHWVMLVVQTASCDKACADRLWAVRQVRLTTGKDMDRIERVLLLAAGAPVPPAAVLAEHPGLKLFRLLPGTSLDWLPLPAAGGSGPDEHIFVIDPLGNLMMRFPRDGDPNRIKKDIGKLLRVSRVG